MSNMQQKRTVREVQHGLARVLAEVGRGVEVLVTKRGKVVAKIIAAAPQTPTRNKRPDFAARLRSFYPDGPARGVAVSDLIKETRERE